MVLVKLANFTERLHIVNNILVNVGEKQLFTAGIQTTIQTTFGRVGTDFLIANNTIDGAFDSAGIWVQSLSRVRIVHNQISNNVPSSGIRLTGVDTATIQGNIASNCRNGLGAEDSTNLQVMGNSFAGIITDGIAFTANAQDVRRSRTCTLYRLQTLRVRWHASPTSLY
jgi:parallel beta-helix repeat protein